MSAIKPVPPKPSEPVGDDANQGEFVEDPRFRRLRRLTSALLIVMIAGSLTVVIALLLKLKELSFDGPGAAGATAAAIIAPGLRPSERLLAAEATSDRITLLLEDADGGRRAVILDATTFRPIASIADGD